jgi:hypothetical protein
VRANAVNGPSDWSPQVWTITTANPPSVPGLAAPADNALTTDYTPILDWANSTVPALTTFGHYQVQVATDNLFTSPVVDVPVSGVTNSQYELTFVLSPNTTYYWRVTAYNSVNDYNSWSVVRRLRTAVVAPNAVSPIDGTAASLRPVFDWSDVSGATGYTIQVSINSSFTALVVNVNITTATSNYTPPANLPLGSLYWRVRANAINGPSDWSTVEEFYTP